MGMGTFVVADASSEEPMARLRYAEGMPESASLARPSCCREEPMARAA
jgi:hypothetical protein